MPLQKLIFKPGINRDQTDYSSEGGWYDCDKIRFRSGFPEKIGGWTVSSYTAYLGACRSLLPYVVNNSTPLTALGTSKKVYIQQGSAIYDITPPRVTYTHSTAPSTDNCFTTGTLGSKIVTVTITGHALAVGDYVGFEGVVGFAGIPSSNFNTGFQVLSTPTANTFTIQVATACTSASTTGGGTAITYYAYIYSGNDTITAGLYWGTGTWGRGTWGSSGTPVYLPARFISEDQQLNVLYFVVRDATGAELYGSGTNPNLFYWVYDNSYLSRSVNMIDYPGLTTPQKNAIPRQTGQILFAPSGHLLALSCTQYLTGTYDALLIRWANVDADNGPEPWNWVPTTTNTAGDLRVQAGTRIMCGVRSRQEILIFTDFSLNSLQFTGTSEVFALQELDNNISIMGPGAVTVVNNAAYWMGVDRFYIYTGRVDTLPCTLRQYIFQNINQSLSSLFFAGGNAEYNEIIWFYASADSSEINRYVIYNYLEQIWYFGSLNRTAWTDAGYVVNPIAAGGGWMYQHEDGVNNGQPQGASPLPIDAYIQSADFDVGDGDKFMLLRRVIPDINFTNSTSGDTATAYITVGVRNFPGASSSTTNQEGQTTSQNVVTTTAVFDQYTNQVFIRARGRQMNFRIESNTLGTQWQLGMPRIDAREDGSRGGSF
jgi:hypothetical protein